MRKAFTEKEVKLAIADYIKSQPARDPVIEKAIDKAFREGIKFVEKVSNSNAKRLPKEYDRRYKMLDEDWELAEHMRSNGETYKSIANHFNVSIPLIFYHFNEEAKIKQLEATKLWRKHNKPSKQEMIEKANKTKQYKRILSARGLI